MKVFIFLYPVKEYINQFLEIDAKNARVHMPGSDLYIKNRLEVYKPRYINDLITARYRNNGFQVAWLFPGCGAGFQTACVSDKSEHVDILPGDLILPSFVDLGKHADAKRVLQSLMIDKSIIDEVVLGGYHQWDCVDNLASWFHYYGVTVRVDEDLTEFYYRMMRTDGIPLIRKESGLDKLSGYLLEDRRRLTINSPWIEQI